MNICVDLDNYSINQLLENFALMIHLQILKIMQYLNLYRAFSEFHILRFLCMKA
jgi:hypothetical protein